MKSTVIDSAILGGQGCIGSKQLAVPNPAPAQPGPDAGVDAALGPQTDASLAYAGACMPETYPMTGTTNEPASQYDTIKQIPEG